MKFIYQWKFRSDPVITYDPVRSGDYTHPAINTCILYRMLFRVIIYYTINMINIIDKIAHGQDIEEFHWHNDGGNDGWTETSSNEPIKKIT